MYQLYMLNENWKIKTNLYFCSHTWFEQFVNGSVLMDAITTGQGSQKDCDAAYKSCPVSQQVIANSLRLLSFL